MSSTRPGGGAGTTPTEPLRIAVTRAASRLGTVLAEHLRADGDLVVGLDDRPARPGALERRSVDIATPHVLDALTDVDVLVHLGFDPDLDAALSQQPAARRARRVTELRTLATAAAAAGIEHLVLVTSGTVLGARPDNPSSLPEDSPARAPEAEGLVADLVVQEAELALLRTVLPALRTTVVRPSVLVGPGVDTVLTRHFEAPRLLVLKGTEPTWSFCHLVDLASALRVVAHEDLPHEVSVSCLGSLTQVEVEEISGLRRVEVPWGTAVAVADRLHRLGVAPMPASDLAYIAHPWASEPLSLGRHGWRPVHDNAGALAALLEEVRGRHAVMARRVTSRDAVGAAAAGAASAGVAVVASAALMRRRRAKG